VVVIEVDGHHVVVFGEGQLVQVVGNETIATATSGVRRAGSAEA